MIMINALIMTSVSPRLLEILIAAAETKNFYEAARRMGISQAAVSLKLKELEGTAPLPIFLLQGKRKILTRYGRELYETAKTKLRGLDRGIEDLQRRYMTEEKLVLRVGCRSEIFEEVAASRLMFGGRVEFHPLSSHQALLALKERRIDVAISYEKPDSAEILAKKLLVSGAHLIVDRRYLFGQALNLRLASDREFLTRTPSLIYREDGHLLNDWLQAFDLEVRDLSVRLVAESWRTIQRLVDLGHGYAIVPDYVRPQSESVETLKLDSALFASFTYFALYHRDLRQVGVFRRLLK
jgi:LysR family transcriptional regulator, low CO2-responsive transcriptional regulator